ncbi:hypothetical protein Leryth_026825 [Lithospermum erythrorhizon]|nr:hypothetical protein Leryth_026825 [Lithospermum erythrorhizon]
MLCEDLGGKSITTEVEVQICSIMFRRRSGTRRRPRTGPRLIFTNKTAQDGRTMADDNIEKGLHCTVRLTSLVCKILSKPTAGEAIAPHLESSNTIDNVKGQDPITKEAFHGPGRS